MLKFSTKGRYALRIMLELARGGHGESVSIRTLSDRQGITPKYMEYIMSMLLHDKLVVSTRGKSGGYRLARPAESYTIYDILRAAEGDLSPVQCLSQEENTCPLKDSCATLPLWEGLGKLLHDYLTGVTLADLTKNAARDTNGCCSAE